MNGCVKHCVKRYVKRTPKYFAECHVEGSAEQPAKQSDKRCVKRFVKWLAWHDDEGSGTISGVALIAVAAIMLAMVAAAGNLLLCLHRVQNMADLASVAAAQALYDGADPCAAAERTLSGNEVALESCSTEDEDVIVTATVSTSVPFVPEVSRRSRAGPIACN